MNVDGIVDSHNISKESVHSDVNNGMCVGPKRSRKRKHVLDESLSSNEGNVDSCIPLSNEIKPDKAKKGRSSIESGEPSNEDNVNSCIPLSNKVKPGEAKKGLSCKESGEPSNLYESNEVKADAIATNKDVSLI